MFTWISAWVHWQCPPSKGHSALSSEFVNTLYCLVYTHFCLCLSQKNVSSMKMASLVSFVLSLAYTISLKNVMIYMHWRLGIQFNIQSACLASKVPEFSLQYSCKKSGVKVCDYNSCTREKEAGGSVWLAGQFWQIKKLQVLWLTLSQKIKH